MKKLLLLFIFFGLFSCTESDKEQFEPEQPEQLDIVTDVYGVQYPSLDPSVIYCGPGQGAKMCRFLNKYDETIWADTENYYSDFSDIKFSSFTGHPFFISFFNFDSTVSYCEGWKKGETTYDGMKWNINFKRDQEDVLWFDYEYYGSSTEIEYTITYKYEVIDGLLHFSSTDGKTFIFHPSQRNYSKDIVETDEIILLKGCIFY
ncbi:hypothetical protein [Aquimarina algiphila]|uniref:hypothetical protein n=1 Tax=Aquimarina algiphila TaxID=2047982 RepID=UPI00232F2855|nr:hypothetical protein [Aquimarina algiphila]